MFWGSVGGGALLCCSLVFVVIFETGVVLAVLELAL